MDLELDAFQLTEDERSALWLSVVRASGETCDEAELQRQFSALEKWAIGVQTRVATFQLILEGLVDVRVNTAGEVRFFASKRTIKVQMQ